MVLSTQPPQHLEEPLQSRGEQSQTGLVPLKPQPESIMPTDPIPPVRFTPMEENLTWYIVEEEVHMRRGLGSQNTCYNWLNDATA